ncbi:hypothetical protein CGK76_01980 [Erysipelotrichaceae bacterium 7770_A6]|nr:hypothetical protein [Erysipelotrichaceae bacterium 7770_A6]
MIKKILDVIKENKFIFICFLTFFAFVMFQHSFLWMYHDDYGYASLSYAYNVQSVVGHSFNFKQLIEFLYGHYMTWGGRILYLGIECFVLSKSLIAFRILQSIVITFIFFYIYKIIIKFSGNSNKKTIAIFVAFLYGLIEVTVLRFGLFWASASVLYAFPILPFMMFIYYFDFNNKNFIKTLSFMILIFCSTFSQEQIAVAAISYLTIILGTNIYKFKKITFSNILVLFSALSGFLLLMLCPGSQMRMQNDTNNGFYELSLLSKLRISVPNTINCLFSPMSKFFIATFMFCIVYICYKNCINKNNKFLFVDVISFISAMLMLTTTIFTNNVYFSYFLGLFNGSKMINILYIIYVLQLCLVLYSLIIFSVKEGEIQLCGLSVGAVFSQAAMLMSSYYPLRSALVFELLFFPVIGYCLTKLLRVFSLHNIFIKVLLISFCCLSFANYSYITYGYYKNSAVNKRNDFILKEKSEEVHEGKTVEEIQLNRLNDLTFSGEQPYVDGQEYILNWIYEYYDIPYDVKIIYK